MFCPNCGNKISEDTAFCPACGNKIASSSPNEELSSAISEFTSQNGSNNKNSNSSSAIGDNNKSNVSILSDRKVRNGLIIGVAVVAAIVVAIIVVNIILAPAREIQSNRDAYNTALTEANSNYKDLENNISSGTTLVNETSSNAVQDASTITKLKDELTNANTIKNNTKIPISEPDDNELVQKTIELQTTTKTLSDENSTLKKLITDVNNSKNSKTNEAYNLTERLNITGKDSSGYEIQSIVKTTSWIKGTDTEKIKSSWKAAGGHSDAPEISSFNSKGSGYQDYSKDTCAVLIGCASFNNKTPNFSITDSNKKNPQIDIDIFDVDYKNIKYNNDPYSSSSWQFKWATNYTTRTDSSDKTSYGTLAWSYGKSSSYNSGNTDIISAEMYKDSWGPVAFMIVAHNIFNPNYPNGDPKIDNVKVSFTPSFRPTGYSFEQYAFLPGKSW